MTAWPGLAVLRHRNYARFAICRFLTSLGWQMLAVALGWQVYALTHDALALGLVGLSEFLPFICLVIFGGHVADQRPRRGILLAGWSVDALSVFALLLLTVFVPQRVWPLYAALAVFGAARAFWWPAAQALVPNLVPAEELPRAVGLSSTLFQIAVITGPVLGGLLYLVGPQWVYGTCSALFLCTVLVILTVHENTGPSASTVASSGDGDNDLWRGLRYVFAEKAVLGIISLDLFAVLFGGATALLPIYASDILHVGAPGLGLLRTAPGVGAALMAVGLTLWPIRRRAGLIMFGGVALFGAATIVFGASTSMPLALLALGIIGASDMASVYVRGVVVQMETPDAIRGRVSAVNAMFIGASNELGEFESGVTARWLGAVRAVVLGGALTLAVVGTWVAWFPQLRRLDRLQIAETPHP